MPGRTENTAKGSVTIFQRNSLASRTAGQTAQLVADFGHDVCPIAARPDCEGADHDLVVIFVRRATFGQICATKKPLAEHVDRRRVL